MAFIIVSAIIPIVDIFLSFSHFKDYSKVKKNLHEKLAFQFVQGKKNLLQKKYYHIKNRKI